MTIDLRCALDVIVEGLALPPSIRAAGLVHDRNTSSGSSAVVVVWAPAEAQCPSCGGQDWRPIAVGCPVTLHPTTGDVEVWASRHDACGFWWGSPWCSVDVDLDALGADDAPAGLADAVEKAAGELAGQVRQRDADAASTLRSLLMTELRAALVDVAAYWPGKDDEPVMEDLSDARAYGPSRAWWRIGSHLEPGVWHEDGPGGGWQAWDYDPSDEGQPLIVTVEDLLP